MARDLTGMVFGELRVLEKAENQEKNGGVWWRSQCACGETYECPGTLLTTGRRTHCSSKVHRRSKKAMDISGQRFRRLTALHPTEKRDPKGYVIWRCRCDCGKELDVPYNNLLYTGLVSCGCRRSEHAADLEDHLTRVAGTSVDSLKSKKLPTNNTTGHRGVYFIKGKYVAKISFQKKSYYLGAFASIEDAVKAREAAQEQLFDATAHFYERWKQRSDADPQWAKENPIQIQVTQQAGSDFSVLLLPKMIG